MRRRTELRYEPHFGKPVKTLVMGDIVVTQLDIMLATLLGSCVAVALHDERLGVGGMVHYLSPAPGLTASVPMPTGQYGSLALPSMLERMRELGCRDRDIRAKVFGGSNQLFPYERDVYAIGPKNSRYALDFLAGHGIPVLRQSLGGGFGRKIYFEVKTFVIYVRRFEKSSLRAG